MAIVVAMAFVIIWKTFILLNFYYISTVEANFHGMVSNLLITESLYQQGDLRLIMCTSFIVADVVVVVVVVVKWGGGG